MIGIGGGVAVGARMVRSIIDGPPGSSATPTTTAYPEPGVPRPIAWRVGD